ncbi:CU044_2847 family protein [Longispora urticae]
MLDLVRFDVGDSTSIVVEAEVGESGFGRAALGVDGIGIAAVSFEHALGQIRSVADAALGELRQLASCPDEIELEFGAKFDGQIGAVLAKASAEGHVQVRLTWKKAAD